ncbi:MAG: hypothetical protein OZ924_10605 [Burkholderiaceae bacterium]|nr:hypothetical protein [Burkholderiaceae bacterium]
MTIDEITVIDEVQVRESLDDEHVERLAALILSGGQYKDPIVLHEEDDGSRRILSDGWHRREGYRRALERFVPSTDVPGLEPLLAEIRPGGLTAAIEYAEEANLAHGKQLSVTGKKNVCFRRWARGHEWVEWSNSMIAGALAITEKTVSAWRAEFEESTGVIYASSRIGADGKMRDVSKIQASNQLRAARQALAKLDLPALVPGSTAHEQARELLRWLNASLQDFKLMANEVGRLRRYLPYALAEELDSAEPRLSYVNWMRGELPKWQDEQEQARQAEIELERADRHARGTHFYLRGRDEQEAILTEMRESILAVLGRAAGWVRGLELRAALGDPASEPYRLAREQLKGEGLIIEDAPPGGRISYRLAPGVSDARASDTQAGDDGWLERSASRGTPPPMAVAANGAPAHSDEDFRTLFAEFLNLGERVAQYIEIELDSDEPPPDWLREGLGTFAGLLHGYAPGDDDVWNPGLVDLVAMCAQRAAEWEDRDR